MRKLTLAVFLMPPNDGYAKPKLITRGKLPGDMFVKYNATGFSTAAPLLLSMTEWTSLPVHVMQQQRTQWQLT